jgi:hypothetical protein
MNTKRLASLALLATSCLWLALPVCSTDLLADTIITTGGARFEGTVTEEKDRFVITTPNGGKMGLSRDQVKEVIRDTPTPAGGATEVSPKGLSSTPSVDITRPEGPTTAFSSKPKDSDSAATARLFADFDRKLDEAKGVGTQAAREQAVKAALASMEGKPVTLTCSVRDVGFSRTSSGAKGTILITVTQAAELPDEWSGERLIHITGTQSQALKIKPGDAVAVSGSLTKWTSNMSGMYMWDNYRVVVRGNLMMLCLKGFRFSVIAAKTDTPQVPGQAETTVAKPEAPVAVPANKQPAYPPPPLPFSDAPNPYHLCKECYYEHDEFSVGHPSKSTKDYPNPLVEGGVEYWGYEDNKGHSWTEIRKVRP